MVRRIFVVTLAMALASCGESNGPREERESPANSAPEAKVAAAGDPCTLIADPAAIFGQPVTSNVATMPNMTKTCEWRTAEQATCGSVTVFGPGWNDVPDVSLNYSAIVSSLGSFGEVREVAGLGSEARAVDGGILGAQVAFRTNDVAVLVGGACSNGSLTKSAVAESVARAVAASL